MERHPTTLLISGSLRVASTNAALLRTAQQLLGGAPAARLYDGLGSLPHFNPDDDVEPLPAPVVELRAAIAAATSLLFCTPEYAGDLPGSFKNLLDWTVGGVEINDTPAAWVNVSTSATAAAGAHAALRTVLSYTGAAIVDAACVHLPVPREAIGPDGTIHDEDIRKRLGATLDTLVNAPA
jgi:NAD(P)H-dependent FMN reductase